MSKIRFEEIFGQNQTNEFYKYETNREVGEKITVYELKSLVSPVYRTFLLWYCTILKINHFAPVLHTDIFIGTI